MAYWSAGFVVMAVVAAVLRLSGLVALSPLDAWALFLVGLILAVITLLLNSRVPVPYRRDEQHRDHPSLTKGPQ
jgi:uncharacterized membrane protein YtjA (UPF0391 family)